MMIPAQVTMIPQFLIMQKLGWYNTPPAALGDEFLWLRLYIFLLRQFLKGIPRDFEDAARLDGCGFFRHLLAHYAALGAPNPRRYCHFYFSRNLERFYGALIYLAINGSIPSPSAFTLSRFNFSPGPPWHGDVHGGVAPDDAAGNRDLLFRPTLLSPRYYIDGNEGIIESLLHRDAMPYFTASISIVGVTLLLMPEMDSEALLNINPKSLRLIGSVVTIQRVRSGSDSLLGGWRISHATSSAWSRRAW